MVAATQEKGKQKEQETASVASIGPPPPQPAAGSTSQSLSTAGDPCDLDSVAHVLKVIQEHQFVVVYFYAQWCGTCKLADPLYRNLILRYSPPPSPDIHFTQFDCGGAEEKLSEDTFNLTWVPTWKLYKDGEIVGTMEGDWTGSVSVLFHHSGKRRDGDRLVSVSFLLTGQLSPWPFSVD
ncbi:hypothetical protein T439DRAFT_32818 [Meredithblackwellia eburnea MCA 4105]